MATTIYAIADDYCLQKLKIVLSYHGIPPSLCDLQLIPADDLLSKDPDAKTITLLGKDIKLYKVNDIMKYLSSLPSTKISLSISTTTGSDVDKWLEVSWNDFEVPLQALFGVTSGKPEFLLSPTDRIKLEQKAIEDISRYLRDLESHLSGKTYIVGETLSLADIAVFSPLTASLKYNVLTRDLYPSVFRWYMTTGMTLSSSDSFDFAPVQGRLTSPVSLGEGRTTGKWSRHRTRIKDLLREGVAAIGQEITVKGWVRTARSGDKDQLLFVELNDGSSPKSIQLVMTKESTVGMESVAVSGGVHASISATGRVVPSEGKGQTIEIHVSSTLVLGPIYGGENGEIGGKNYPMSKKKHSLEFLREKAHLRPRSKLFSSALRIRHAMAFATHKFFNDRGFVYVHTPLITGADCEGAGEQFTVTSLLPEGAKLKDVPVDKQGNVDFSKDFFNRRCALTVSGQLNVETHACALSDVYTFGPTFRAEDSHTSRHLAEFWMIEPEICFADLADDMALAEDYVRYCAAYALEHCADDIAYFEHEYPEGEKGLSDRLKNVVNSDFAQITYTEGVEILQRDIKEKKVKFERYPNWGDDLGSEHERYLCEKIFNRPTIVINYPKGIKAFYMKVNDDNETVAAMDILVPKIGELVGGSQREDRFDVLERRCLDVGLKPEDMWWYLELRKFGTVPHAGFGLGFERLIMFVTGLENIRDVIPFPRYPGHAEF